VYCPYCRHPDSRVIDSRAAEDGTAIRRRRSCPECGRRFTTQETVILMVGKRSGATEPFNRDKIVSGVRRACQGRPVTEDQLAILAQRVEEAIRSRGLGEVPSHEVGLAILGPLRALDEVAYLRFASVYRGFESLDDFEAEIAALRAKRDEKWRAAVAELDRDQGGNGDQGGDGKNDDGDSGTGDSGLAAAWQPSRN
jgi:transcriptional repressor NrdR